MCSNVPKCANSRTSVLNPYAINGPYMSLKATLSTDQWAIYGLSQKQTIALTLNFQFSTE